MYSIDLSGILVYPNQAYIDKLGLDTVLLY